MKNILVIIFLLFLTTCTQPQKKGVITNLGHSKWVNSVAFSPNGKYIVSGSDDNTIKLWSVKTGKEIRTFEDHTEAVKSVAFSPDGKYIISGSYDKTIKLWNVNTGEEIKTFEGHRGYVLGVAFSTDGKYIVSGSDDETIKLWNIKTGQEIRTFNGHTDYVRSVAFSPDGKNIVSGSDYKIIKLWNVKTGKEIRIFEGHKSCTESVSFSPDGKNIISGNRDKTIKLWNIKTGEEIRTIKGHTKEINSVAFSPDEKYIVSGSDDETIKLWNIKTGEEIRTFKGHTDYVRSVAFSPDGKYIMSGSDDGTCKIWNTETGELLATIIGISSNLGDWIVYTPDGKYDGENCSKYLHYVSGMETYNLPENDPNHVSGLLAKIFGEEKIIYPPVVNRSGGKDYALFFANQDYNNSEWTDLNNPIKDAKAIAKDLRIIFGFETKIFENKTRNEILKIIRDYQKRSFNENDQLFICLSGHGKKDDLKSNLINGYFIPADGEDFFGTHLSYSNLKSQIAAIPCNHILLVIDACESSSLFKKLIVQKGKPVPRKPQQTSELQKFVNKSMQYKSRLAITAGMNAISDGDNHSKLTNNFLKLFSQFLNKHNTEKVLIYDEIKSFLLKNGSSTEDFGRFENHEDSGNFLFIVK